MILFLGILSAAAKTPVFPDSICSGQYPRLVPASEDATEITFPIEADSLYNFTLIVRNNHNSPRKNYRVTASDGRKMVFRSPQWGIIFVGAGEEQTVSVTFSIVEETEQLEPQTCTKMTVSTGDTIEIIKTFKPSQFPWRTPAILSCSVDGAEAVVSGGTDSRNTLWSGRIPFEVREIGITAAPGSDIELLHTSLIATPQQFIKAGKWADPYYLDAVLSHSADPLVGYWALLDATYEASNTQSGGDYLLAAVAEDEKYTLIYLDGCRTQEWQPGMPKAFLRPTSIPGVYNVEWREAHGGKVSESVKAQLDNGILTIYFPASGATLRFSAVDRNPVLKH